MSTKLTPFAFGDQLVRTMIDEHGNPWFVVKDVCQVLEIQNPSDTVRKLLDEDEKGIATIYTLGGEQELLIISESGLYSLIFRSRKPEAKIFSKWVRGEVLPSLRKTGTYTMPSPAGAGQSAGAGAGAFAFPRSAGTGHPIAGICPAFASVHAHAALAGCLAVRPTGRSRDAVCGGVLCQALHCHGHDAQD